MQVIQKSCQNLIIGSLNDKQQFNKFSQLKIFINDQLINKNKIIINADDFGHSQFRDKGIIQLIKLKKIKSISIMINGRNIKNSAKQIKHLFLKKQKKNVIQQQQIQKINLPQKNEQTNNSNDNQKFNYLDLSIGLHFNLTQGHSNSTKSFKNILLNSQSNQFIGKQNFYKIFKELKNNNQSLSIEIKEFIKEQFNHQIKQFIKIFNFRPSHIDGHNHIHIIPQICQLIVPIMRQYGIYKARLPYQNLTLSNKSQFNYNFNNLFIENSLKSKIIFDKFNIIYPNHFIGLEDINSLNHQSISKKLQSLIMNKQKLFIELMCHPGYKDQNYGEQFNKSISRQIQMNSLKSSQFNQEIFQKFQIQLANFHKLQYKYNNKKKILLYSKMNIGSGNWTTSLRLQTIFQSLGYQVYLRSIEQQLNIYSEIDSLKNFLINFKISLIIGVNLTRSAQIIYQATRSQHQITYRVPIIFIVAGTDANIYFNKPQATLTLYQPIKQASLLISLSQDMVQLTNYFIKQKLKISDKKLIYLSQSSNIKTFQSSGQQLLIILKNIQQNYSILFKKTKYIVFPTSFRPVKDVCFLIQSFNKLIELYPELRIFILGPILQEMYYNQCKLKLGKVQYIGTLSKQIYIEFLKNALFLINTSISEGQSCSIQQALQVGQLCVVRNNKGNSQIIKHNQTGFLFNNSYQFQEMFNIIWNQENTEKLKIIKQNGKKYHYQNFSITAQTQKYKNILSQIFPNKEKLYTYHETHPVSDVNLQLYNQIPPQIIIQWLESQQNITKRIIDIGCGSGIFGRSVVKKILQKFHRRIQLEFYDIQSKILSNCYYNVIQLIEQEFKEVKSIYLKISDMYKNISNSQKRNLFVANMPQTPFQYSQTRPDRNGGTNALKYNIELIKEFSRYQKGSILIMLYSYMSNPINFFSKIQQFNLEIIFKSSKINHIIPSQNYEAMQNGLSKFIKEHIQKTKSQVYVQITQTGKQIFKVPAQILILRRKI